MVDPGISQSANPRHPIYFFTTHLEDIHLSLHNTVHISTMPAPSWERKDIDPPDQVTSEAVTGFLAGAFRVREYQRHHLITREVFKEYENTNPYTVRLCLHPRTHDYDPPPSVPLLTPRITSDPIRPVAKGARATSSVALLERAFAIKILLPAAGKLL